MWLVVAGIPAEVGPGLSCDRGAIGEGEAV